MRISDWSDVCSSDLQALSIAHEEIEERNRIEARPFAERPGLVPAHRSRRHQPDQRAPAVQAHDRHRSRLAPAEDAMAAVRERGIDPSLEEPRIDAVNQLVKTTAEQPRQQAPAGREGAVGGDEMAAAMGRLLVHTPPRKVRWRAVPW